MSKLHDLYDAAVVKQKATADALTNAGRDTLAKCVGDDAAASAELGVIEKQMSDEATVMRDAAIADAADAQDVADKAAAKAAAKAAKKSVRPGAGRNA